jgi:hypothetical protein
VPSWSYFSTYDQVAYKYLYPGPAPSLTSQGYSSGQPSFSWSSVSDASSYQVGKTVYYYEFILYDPQVSSTDGYWGYQGYSAGTTTVFGTSYTDTSATPVSDGSCYSQYDVSPKYPSGKVGAGTTTNSFDAC